MGSVLSTLESYRDSLIQSDETGSGDFAPKSSTHDGIEANERLLSHGVDVGVRHGSEEDGSVEETADRGSGGGDGPDETTRAAVTWDPVMRLYETCAARKLDRPRFECEATTTQIAGTTVHGFAVGCTVEADGRAYSCRGVAVKKNAAKRIAALEVFERMVRRQVENAAERAAAMALPTSSHERVENYSTVGHVDEQSTMSARMSSGDSGPMEPDETPVEVNSERNDVAVERRTTTDSTRRVEDVGGETTRLSKPTITKLYELCVSRKWNRPRFEYEVAVTSVGNSTVHSFTAKCTVETDDRVYSSQGVAGKKNAAKGIAATNVLEKIENDAIAKAAAAATEIPTSSPRHRVESDSTVDPHLDGESIDTLHTCLSDAGQGESAEIPDEVNSEHNEVVVDQRTTADAGHAGTVSKKNIELSEFSVSKLYELCTARKYASPQFEYSACPSPYTVKCSLVVDYLTFSAEGVARTKKAAKKLAALTIYTEFTEHRPEEVIRVTRPSS